MGTMDDAIITFTGRRANLFALDAEDVQIEDVAHHLACVARFTGATPAPYSVAQHSVLVSRKCEGWQPGTGLWGLLHDAGEAYLGELIRPIKRRLPPYKEQEVRLLRTVAQRFGLCWPMPPVVRWVDDRLLATEARDLLHPFGQLKDGYGAAVPLEAIISPWEWEDAEQRFLERFNLLTGGDRPPALSATELNEALFVVLEVTPRGVNGEIAEATIRPRAKGTPLMTLRGPWPDRASAYRAAAAAIKAAA